MYNVQLLEQISFGAAPNEQQMALSLCVEVDSIDIVLLSAATSIHGHVQHWALCVWSPLLYLSCVCSVFAAHPYCVE